MLVPVSARAAVVVLRNSNANGTLPIVDTGMARSIAFSFVETASLYDSKTRYMLSGSPQYFVPSKSGSPQRYHGVRQTDQACFSLWENAKHEGHNISRIWPAYIPYVPATLAER
jgi:hypothetical protein